MNNVDSHSESCIRIQQPQEKIYPQLLPNNLLESRENKEGVDQWMVTWTLSHKVRVLFPNIGRSLVGHFLDITSTRNAGGSVNIFPLQDFWALSPSYNNCLKQLM
jgi:hypothetical protein